MSAVAARGGEGAELHPEVMGSDHCPVSLTLSFRRAGAVGHSLAGAVRRAALGNRSASCGAAAAVLAAAASEAGVPRFRDARLVGDRQGLRQRRR